VIDGPAGPLGLRVLSSGNVRACYLHVHGGGWALGGPDRQEQTLLRFASAARVALVAVDYRLTPEHPHPAGLADCVAAIRWLAANGQRELGAGRLIVGGESAGAHLAALAVLVLRDRGEIASVTAANLAYGVYDVSMTPSARRWGDQRIVINTPELTFFAKHYALKEPHRDPDSRHSMPTSPACRLPCSVAARSIHCSTTRCSWPPGGRRPEARPSWRSTRGAP
jgi:acetyl esterase